MYIIKPLNNLNKEIDIPADKSITHRAIIVSALASNTTSITPFFPSKDTAATLDCVKRCGIKTHFKKNKTLVIRGEGLYLPRKKKVTLYAGESGTTFRVFCGVLCGQKFQSFFETLPSLKKRPMARITVPLSFMGANIEARHLKSEDYPPFIIRPVKELKGIRYSLPVASAQVKSAIMFASLYAANKTLIHEPRICRDHTERMFSAFGIDVIRRGKTICLNPVKKILGPGKIFIPSDFSSASFFIVLGLILKNSQILIKKVNLNPSRCGLLRVLKRMGAKIRILNKIDYFEPYADILVKSSDLKSATINADEIPSMIDEVQILAVAASFARGKTTINGVGELKIKETDRIYATIYNLRKAGVSISAKRKINNKDINWAIEITGARKFKPAKFKCFSDHRTAMSAFIVAAAAGRECEIDDVRCINKSFPQFISTFESLSIK